MVIARNTSIIETGIRRDPPLFFMKLNRHLFAGMLLVPALFLVPALRATPIAAGQANIGGNVTVQDGTIAFAPSITSTTGATETGDFAGLTGGTIQTLTGGPFTGTLATPVTNFISFSTGVVTPVSFDLTYVAPGVGTVAGCSSASFGSSCTPAGSPFTLFQLSSNTILVSLQLNGISYTGSSATGSSPTTAIFSTQTLGTLPQIYSTLLSGGAISGVTYSASFVSTAGTTTPNIPEPFSMGLVAVGMIAAGLIARRRKVA